MSGVAATGNRNLGCIPQSGGVFAFGPEPGQPRSGVLIQNPILPEKLLRAQLLMAFYTLRKKIPDRLDHRRLQIRSRQSGQSRGAGP